MNPGGWNPASSKRQQQQKRQANPYAPLRYIALSDVPASVTVSHTEEGMRDKGPDQARTRRAHAMESPGPSRPEYEVTPESRGANPGREVADRTTNLL